MNIKELKWHVSKITGDLFCLLPFDGNASIDKVNDQYHWCIAFEFITLEYWRRGFSNSEDEAKQKVQEVVNEELSKWCQV